CSGEVAAGSPTRTCAKWNRAGSSVTINICGLSDDATAGIVAPNMLIPRIIHQTWKDDAPPARLASFQAAWRRLHPDWTYRFWTDATTRAFVAEHYPDFLAAYDGYR